MMKIKLTQIYFVLTIFISNAQTTYFVDASQPNNNGDGLSWATAKKDIAAAVDIANAIANDEVWVKSGNYFDESSLNTKSGISIFGGFVGGESFKSQRAKSDLDGNGIIEPWEFTNLTQFTSTINNKAIINITGIIDGLVIIHNVDEINTHTASVDILKGGIVQNCIFKNSTISLSNLTTNIGGAIIETEGDFLNNLIENNTVTISQTGNNKFCALLNAQPSNSVYTVQIKGNVFRNNKAIITGIDADSNPSNLRGILLNITGKAYANEVQFVNNLVHNNEASYSSTGVYSKADRAGGLFSILTFSTTETKSTFVNNTFANNKCTNLPAVFHIYKGNEKHLYSIHNNVYWNNRLDNVTNGLYSNVTQLLGSSITNNFCDVAIGGNVSEGFMNNIEDVSTLNSGVNSPLFENPTEFVGCTDDGSVEKSNWRITSEDSYLFEGGVAYPGVAKDKAGYSYKAPPGVGAYETLPLGKNSEINVIRNKYVNWLTGAKVDYSRPEVMIRYQEFLNFGERAKNVSAYDFDNPGDDWDFSISSDIAECRILFESHLIRLVYLYSIQGPIGSSNPDYKSETLKNTILDLFKYIKDKGVSATTNFGGVLNEESELISPGGTILNRTTAYGTSVLLMKDELKEAGQFEHHMGALNKCSSYLDPNVTIFKFTYPGMSADVLRALGQQRFAYILALDDENPEKIPNMEFFQAFMNNGLLVSRGWRDTLKPDFMMFHHRGPYGNAYGCQAMHVSSILNWMLCDTSFELNAKAQENLFKALMSYNILSYDFELANGLMGRFPQNTTPLATFRSSYAYLYLTNPTLFLEAGQEFTRLWNRSTTENMKLQKSTILAISLLHSLGGMDDMMSVIDDNLTPALDKKGHFGFGYGGLNIHRFDDFMVSQKGTNKHIWNFENSSTENLYGRYTSAGAMDILLSGNPVSRLASGISDDGKDWSHIPGTTVSYLTIEKMKVLGKNDDRNMNSKDFLAHAELGDYGVFGMDYEDISAVNKMSALKTSFFFNDKILCLGSDIKNADGENPIHTTLFQSRLSNEDYVTYVNNNAITGVDYDFNQSSGGFWATDAVGNGYIVPSNPFNSGTIYVKRDAQTSRDHRDTKNTYGDFVSSWIDHGLNPQNDSYQYAIYVKGGASGTKGMSDNFSDYFSVIQQDEIAHIAKYVPDSVTGYVVFQPENFVADEVLKSIDKPAIVMAQSLKIEEKNKLKLSLTNPDLGLLDAGEFYTYSQINANSSVLNKIPENTNVTLELQELWEIEKETDNVSIENILDYTQIVFTTSHGASIEVLLSKKDSLSVDRETGFGDIKMFPNPSKDSFVISSLTNLDYTSLKIYNRLGQEVEFEKNNIANDVEIRILNQPRGVYFVCIDGWSKKMLKI